jgi:hypothetical protein
MCVIVPWSRWLRGRWRIREVRLCGARARLTQPVM